MANWNKVDENDETPGCIALRRNLPEVVYKKFVQAGTRAEVFLRRMTSLQFGSEESEGDGEEEEEEEEENVATPEQLQQFESNNSIILQEEQKQDPAMDQSAYLSAELTYTDHALVTSTQNDGVMMDWETPIMERSAALLTTDSDGDGSGPVVLNVGFGMGIIDGFIQSSSSTNSLPPKKHYICEAHPTVLAKLKRDGWYEKPGVVILEGRWQDTLAQLLREGTIYFDGMYYDTFSEHYTDLVDFFDVVVGLLKPNGVFSFFNGLGADRQICYDVYCEVVEVDLLDYGLEVKYEPYEVDDAVVNVGRGSKGDQEKEEDADAEADKKKEKVWEGIRKQYWTIKTYQLPIIKFIGA